MTAIDWNLVFRYVLVFAVVGFTTAGVMGILAWRSVRRLRLAENATFLEALYVTPLPVVVLLDMLDFFFDIFSAPLTWALLGFLGLRPLRAVTVAEAVVPGTQLIPTMTLLWLTARVLGPRGSGSPFARMSSRTPRPLPDRSLHRR